MDVGSSPQDLKSVPAFLLSWPLLRHVGHDDRGDEDVHEGDLEKEDPAEAHELVVAETAGASSAPR